MRRHALDPPVAPPAAVNALAGLLGPIAAGDHSRGFFSARPQLFATRDEPTVFSRRRLPETEHVVILDPSQHRHSASRAVAAVSRGEEEDEEEAPHLRFTTALRVAVGINEVDDDDDDDDEDTRYLFDRVTTHVYVYLLHLIHHAMAADAASSSTLDSRTALLIATDGDAGSGEPPRAHITRATLARAARRQTLALALAFASRGGDAANTLVALPPQALAHVYACIVGDLSLFRGAAFAFRYGVPLGDGEATDSIGVGVILDDGHAVGIQRRLSTYIRGLR